jgi:hypothetical protein
MAFLSDCSFLLLLQKKRTKEKETGNDNFSLPYARFEGLIGATG